MDSMQVNILYGKSSELKIMASHDHNEFRVNTAADKIKRIKELFGTVELPVGHVGSPPYPGMP